MSDDAPHRTSRPAQIRTPDQLQQAKRSDPPRPSGKGLPRDVREAPRRQAGILEQLETERAHD